MVCEHSIVMKDMCAQCGEDLRVKDGVAGQRKEAAKASVSMVHHVPELHVSNDLAKELGNKDRTNVLSHKKLVLLVDLDQTIIHTTNTPFEGPMTEDIFKYAITNNRYFTKIRPHCRQFLEKMTTMYEMHIVTFGQRQYAHLIAGQLDPDKRYFGERIMSRDELFNNIQKTQNLKALFPCGEELIAIIDDRRDVWEDMENLVQVKPYKFFRDVGDINAPAAKRFVEAEKAAKGPEQPSTSAEAPAEAEDETDSDDAKEKSEEDRTLQYVEQVLTEAHRRFYDHYERTKEVLDMKNVIANIRREVLCGVCVVLSGIIPQNEDPRKFYVYQLLIRFGADIQDTVTADTNLVIGARLGTTKVHAAHRTGVPVVSMKWLDAVCEQWKKVPFEEYKLSKDSVNDKSQHIHAHMKTGSLANMETFRKEQIKSMADEVDEALSGDDDDDDEDEENNDEAKEGEAEEESPLGSLEVEDDTDKYSEQDSRSTSNDDFAEPARKRRRKEDEDDEENREFDDLDESIGDDGNTNDDDDVDDEDDELAKELEEQFFS